MNLYEFTLKFSLPDEPMDADDYLMHLSQSGCDDALIGMGVNGRIALAFSREAKSAIAAISSAIDDVRAAIPGAKLTEAGPDFVGLSDVAELLGFSRQNMRKLMLANRATFPPPVHDGNASIWHLTHIIDWFETYKTYNIEPALIDVADLALQINAIRDRKYIRADIRDRFKAFIDAG